MMNGTAKKKGFFKRQFIMIAVIADRTATDHLKRATEVMLLKATDPFVNQNLTKPL
jgi:hypothetical protein